MSSNNSEIPSTPVKANPFSVSDLFAPAKNTKFLFPPSSATSDGNPFISPLPVFDFTGASTVQFKNVAHPIKYSYYIGNSCVFGAGVKNNLHESWLNNNKKVQNKPVDRARATDDNIVDWYLHLNVFADQQFTNIAMKTLYSCVLSLYFSFKDFCTNELIAEGNAYTSKLIKCCLTLLQEYPIRTTYDETEMDSFYLILSLCIELNAHCAFTLEVHRTMASKLIEIVRVMLNMQDVLI